MPRRATDSCSCSTGRVRFVRPGSGISRIGPAVNCAAPGAPVSFSTTIGSRSLPTQLPRDFAGRLVLVDRESLSFNPAFFARSSGDFQVPDSLALERLAASPDGKWLAAAADASKVPLVCVWETATGKLTHWIPAAALEDAVLSLSFSTDSRYLLTGGDSPAAKLWDLSATQGVVQAPSVVFSARSVRKNITCAAIRPGSHGQVVTGHSDGQVHLWSWNGSKAKLENAGFVQGEFSGAVKSVCFTSDGAYLTAAGDGLTIWVGAMEPRPHAIDVLSKLRPHHIEQINTLAAWKDLPVVISGGDDTSVRFWDLKNGSLWGTFAAAAAPVVAAIGRGSRSGMGLLHARRTVRRPAGGDQARTVPTPGPAPLARSIRENEQRIWAQRAPARRREAPGRRPGPRSLRRSRSVHRRAPIRLCRRPGSRLPSVRRT